MDRVGEHAARGVRVFCSPPFAASPQGPWVAFWSGHFFSPAARAPLGSRGKATCRDRLLVVRFALSPSAWESLYGPSRLLFLHPVPRYSSRPASTASSMSTYESHTARHASAVSDKYISPYVGFEAISRAHHAAAVAGKRATAPLAATQTSSGLTFLVICKAKANPPVSPPACRFYVIKGVSVYILRPKKWYK